MRRMLAGALVGAGLVTASLPAAPAAADCNVLVLALTGQCHNACTLVALAYRTADATAFDVLPDVPFACPA